MPSRIDHVILAAPDLAQLETTFARLGFAVVGGGTHPHLGTRNRLVLLGEGYIELLAIHEPRRVSPALAARIATGAGWVGYALQSEDIAAEAEAMRARGVDTRGPSAGRLVAPDGTTRSWRVVTLNSDDLWGAALPLPFLIQHDSAGERHRQELAGADRLAPHPNGASRLLGVTLATEALDELRRDYEHDYGLSPANAESDDGDVVLPLAHGAEWIRLARLSVADTNADPLMTVRVGASDLDAIERLARQAGFTVSPLPDALRVALPTITTAIEFARA